MPDSVTDPFLFDDLYETVSFENTVTGSPHLLETFGDELKLVQNTDPKHVWTVMDQPENNHQIIVAGMHFINRINYVITTTPWKHENETYPW